MDPTLIKKIFPVAIGIFLNGCANTSSNPGDYLATWSDYYAYEHNRCGHLYKDLVTPDSKHIPGTPNFNLEAQRLEVTNELTLAEISECKVSAEQDWDSVHSTKAKDAIKAGGVVCIGGKDQPVQCYSPPH